MPFTFPKSERLSSSKAIEALFESGRGEFVYPFRYIILPDERGVGAENGTASACEPSKASSPTGAGSSPAGRRRSAEEGNFAQAATDAKPRAEQPQVELCRGAKEEDRRSTPGREAARSPQPAKAEASGGVKVLISVSKRNHKHAVVRNLIKRRTREAWRLNKAPLAAAYADTDGVGLHVGLIYSSKTIEEYPAIEAAVRKIIAKLCASAAATNPSRENA